MECFPKFCTPIVWYIFIINREDRKFEHGGERGDEVTIGGTRMIVGLMKIGALDRWTQGW